MSNELPQDNSSELSDDVYYAVDTLIVEVFSLKSQLSAIEKLLLANCALHPDVTKNMRLGYAESLNEGIPLLQLADAMLLTEEGSEMLLRKINAIREHILSVMETPEGSSSSLAN